MEKSKNKISRYLIGLIGAPIIFLIFSLNNHWVLSGLLVIISLICLYEYYSAFKEKNKANPSKWIGYLFSIILIPCGILLKQSFLPVLVVFLLISLFVLFTEMIVLNDKKNFKDVLISFFGIIYLPVFLTMLTLIMNIVPLGNFYIFYILTTSWGSDTFAYIVGNKIGKHKLTKVSPNKTIEGAIGGIIGSVVFSLLCTLVINNAYQLNISYLNISIISFVLSIIGQIGDLIASAIKRYTGIKDFGNLLPGHGGMLDRIDSLIFIVPFAYILFSML